MKTLRLFRPGGTVSRRVLLREVDSAGVEVFRYRVSRQELAYLRAMGRVR